MDAISAAHDGGIQMIAGIASDADFGALVQVDHNDNKELKGAFDSLGKAMGMANAGGAATSKTDYATRTSPQAYAGAALDALGRATGTFAKWFQKYPAK